MDLQKVGCGGMDWIELAQYRTGGGLLYTRYELPGSIKCEEFFD
jgi:hypothetical protein